MRFCVPTAATTSAGARPRACIAGRSRSTEIWRILPPYGNGIATPGIVTSCGRSWFTAESNTVCSGSVGLDSASWITGTLDAENLSTSGGVMPGGSWRTCDCMIDTTCASAVWMFAVGWKNTLMTVMPASERDSMCSMSLTVVVRPRSLWPAMRCPISCALSPLYDQMIVITGMSISGKMSTAILRSVNGVASRISIAITMNVYGRRRARPTMPEPAPVLGLGLMRDNPGRTG
jgi:hypothetical protein